MGSERFERGVLNLSMGSGKEGERSYFYFGSGCELMTLNDYISRMKGPERKLVSSYAEVCPGIYRELLECLELNSKGPLCRHQLHLLNMIQTLEQSIKGFESNVTRSKSRCKFSNWMKHDPIACLCFIVSFQIFKAEVGPEGETTFRLMKLQGCNVSEISGWKSLMSKMMIDGRFDVTGLLTGDVSEVTERDFSSLELNPDYTDKVGGGLVEEEPLEAESLNVGVPVDALTSEMLRLSELISTHERQKALLEERLSIHSDGVMSHLSRLESEQQRLRAELQSSHEELRKRVKQNSKATLGVLLKQPTEDERLNWGQESLELKSLRKSFNEVSEAISKMKEESEAVLQREKQVSHDLKIMRQSIESSIRQNHWEIERLSQESNDSKLVLNGSLRALKMVSDKANLSLGLSATSAALSSVSLPSSLSRLTKENLEDLLISIVVCVTTMTICRKKKWSVSHSALISIASGVTATVMLSLMHKRTDAQCALPRSPTLRRHDDDVDE